MVLCRQDLGKGFPVYRLQLFFPDGFPESFEIRRHGIKWSEVSGSVQVIDRNFAKGVGLVVGNALCGKHDLKIKTRKQSELLTIFCYSQPGYRLSRVNW